MRHTIHVVITTLLLGSMLTAQGVGQGRRPMTIDDLIESVRISDPVVSPDGHTVAFVRTTTRRGAAARNADIYVADLNGTTPPRALASDERSDTAPAFSPDGSRLAFISTRDGESQVFVVPIGGGSPKRVTSVSGGVQAPLLYSPDGMSVAFVSDVYPDCADEPCNRARREAAEKDPVKMRRLTRLLFRHWDEWRETVRHHVFIANIERVVARDLTPGDFDSPPHDYEANAIAFSPDGMQIAFVSKRNGPDREAWTTNQDVWVVPVAGGPPQKVTTNPAADVQPLFSPDGKSLLTRSQRREGFESDRWHLDLRDLTTGTTRTLFQTPDLSVGDVQFSTDGRLVWFTAPDHGGEGLFVIPVSGGKPQRVGGAGSVGAFDSGRDFVVATRSTLVAPAVLVRIAADGNERVVASENDAWLDEVEMPSVESRTVSGADGADVQYWLLKPPGFNSSQKYPAVFIIHGGPQGATEDTWSYRWNPALWAAQGWVVAAPNPRGSLGFGQPFTDGISQDWSGKVMIDLNAVFDAVSKMPFVDAGRLGLAGASYGGYAVNWIISHTDRFKAAVSHDGIFNLESMALATEELWFMEWEFGGPPWSARARNNFAKSSPHLSAVRMHTPTLVITNEQDFRVPLDQGLQLLTALRRNGVPAEALVFPDEGHWVNKPLNSKRWHEAVFDWMRRYLSEPSRVSMARPR